MTAFLGSVWSAAVCRATLTRLFRRRGYTEIMTPEMEFYDVFTLAGNNIPQENLTKVIDRSGKICVMRPDMTTPIARVAGTKLKDMVLPRRFYYNGNVYRSSSGHKGENSEIPQCGVELIGAGGIKADLEVIAVAVEAMKACGLEKFHVELGHAGIFRLFADRLEMDEEEEEKMRLLIEGKNYAALNDFLQPYETQAGLCGHQAPELPLRRRRGSGRGRSAPGRRLSGDDLPADAVRNPLCRRVWGPREV